MGVTWCSGDGLKVRENGQLTACFVDTLLLIPTAVVVFLLLPVFVVILCNESKRFGHTCMRFKHHAQRWFLTMLLLLCLLAKVGEGFMLQEMISTTSLHLYLPNMLSFLCLVAVTVYYDVVEVSQKVPVRRLVVLFVYWLSSVVVWTVKFARLYKVEGPFDIRLYTNLCILVFYTLLLIIERRVISSHLPTRSRFHKWTKANQREQQEEEDDGGGGDCREFQEGRVKFVHHFANFLSRVTYSWLGTILRLGSSRPLELDDLGDLPSVDKADVNHQCFFKVWEKEKIRAAKHRTRPSLWRTYFNGYRFLLIKAAMCRLCGDLLSFIGPLSLKQIVKYVEVALKSDQNGEVKPESEMDVFLSVSDFFSNGFVLAVAILLGNIGMSSFLQYYFYISFRLCLKLRASLQVKYSM